MQALSKKQPCTVWGWVAVNDRFGCYVMPLPSPPPSPSPVLSPLMFLDTHVPSQTPQGLQVGWDQLLRCQFWTLCQSDHLEPRDCLVWAVPPTTRKTARKGRWRAKDIDERESAKEGGANEDKAGRKAREKDGKDERWWRWRGISQELLSVTRLRADFVVTPRRWSQTKRRWKASLQIM